MSRQSENKQEPILTAMQIKWQMSEQAPVRSGALVSILSCFLQYLPHLIKIRRKFRSIAAFQGAVVLFSELNGQFGDDLGRPGGKNQDPIGDANRFG